MTFTDQGPSRTGVTIAAEFPDMDESSMDVGRLRTLMERGARNIKRLVESEPPSATTRFFVARKVLAAAVCLDSGRLKDVRWEPQPQDRFRRRDFLAGPTGRRLRMQWSM